MLRPKRTENQERVEHSLDFRSTQWVIDADVDESASVAARKLRFVSAIWVYR